VSWRLLIVLVVAALVFGGVAGWAGGNADAGWWETLKFWESPSKLERFQNQSEQRRQEALDELISDRQRERIFGDGIFLQKAPLSPIRNEGGKQLATKLQYRGSLSVHDSRSTPEWQASTVKLPSMAGQLSFDQRGTDSGSSSINTSPWSGNVVTKPGYTRGAKG